MNEKNFVAKILKKLTKEINASLILEPIGECTGKITFSNGKTTFFVETRFSINPHGSVEVARNKDYSKFFLNEFGYKVPMGKTFYIKDGISNIELNKTINDGLKFVNSIGFPIILKPIDLSQGKLVTKNFTKNEFFQTIREIYKYHNTVIIEKFYNFNDYRVVIYDDSLVCAYQRKSLRLIGDGVLNIEELFAERRDFLFEQGRDFSVNLMDFRIVQNLKRKAYNLNTILKDKEELNLLDNANLSEGGSMENITSTIHKNYIDLAISVTQSIGLKLCGVDIMTNDISKPINDYIILEINSAPGFEHFSSESDQNYNTTENIYREILTKLENY